MGETESTELRVSDQFAELGLRSTSTSFCYDATEGWPEPFPDLDSERTLLVVFAADGFIANQQPLNDLRRAFPLSTIVGCGAAQTWHNGEMESDVITVGVIKFHSTELRLVTSDLTLITESRSAGEELGRQLADPGLKGVLIYSKGVDVAGTELVRGLQANLAAGIPISGGLASNRLEGQSWVYANGSVLTDAVCAVGLIGDKVELVGAAGGGWAPTSEQYVATKSSGLKLYEIDDRPAYDVLAELGLTDDVEEAPWSPNISARSIALKLDGVDVVRSIVSSSAEEGWIEVAGTIDEGMRIQFMKSSVDELLDGVDEAAHGIRMRTVGLTEESLCVTVGCMGRIAILGERASEEAAGLRDAIGVEIEQIGMCSFGEILTTSSGHPQMHNMTLNVAVIREH